MASERILVVDDEEANREFLYELLTHEGYEVETAADGFVGLELLQQVPVNLLLRSCCKIISPYFSVRYERY